MLPMRVEYDDEMHPAYYLQKLARLHGYLSLKNMVKAFGLKMPKNYNGNIERYNDIIEETTGINLSLTERYGFEYDMTRHITSLIHTGPNVCPCCLDERKVSFDTRYVTSTYCFEHKCKTEQFCNHCGAAFEWDNTLLSGCCGHCGQQIQTRYSEPPSYLTFMVDLDESKLAEFLDDVALAIGFTLRPYDIVPERVNRDAITNWEETLELAFLLLTERKSIENWLANIKQVKGAEFTSSNLLYAGPRYLIRKTKLDWPVLAQVVTELPPLNGFKLSKELVAIQPKDFGIKPNWKTKGYTAEQQDALARSKCTIDVVSDVLGCSISDAQSLTINNNLDTLVSTKTGVIALFDVNQLNDFESKLATTSITEPIEPLLSSGFLNLFYCDFSDVFSLVNKYPTIFRLSNGTGGTFSRIRLANRVKYIRAILSIFKSRCDDKVVVDDAINMFGFSNKDLRILWQQDLAFSLRWQRAATYYRLGDLVNIDEKVFNFKRYCLVKGLDFAKISSELAEVEIFPIVGDSFFQCKSQVLTFLRTGEYIEPVNLFQPKRANDWYFGPKLTA